ncbi:cytochrome-c peroxidase [Echinicola vietnamensis]|uniref:Cytochrome c peroxidase n=1 Tax=Echinicola vietnamensis (strain DSM 17526 / LMG 23754 / KMM 6221) TaxID=926556 RepID=L0FVA2_ECHVK|nr:cytochrome c peroxidase [Echinicola vietnamensis]AGA77237.1 cytochrome c peroxidase [Echinicola vietnamensis DSM 17526]
MRHLLSQKAYGFIGLLVFLSCFIACNRQADTTHDEAPIDQLAAQYYGHLRASFLHLDSLAQSQDPQKVEGYFLNARKHFKMAEPILAFMDSENYKFLNQPNIPKIEEEDFTDIKIKSPKGFQVLEESIFVENPDWESISKTANVTAARMKLLHDNTSFDFVQPYHVLWMVRDGFVRVALTGITGFDSPVLEQSLAEARDVYAGLEEMITLYRGHFKDQALYERVIQALDNSVTALQGDFSTFDRYGFIKAHTQPMLGMWNEVVKDWGVTFPFEKAIRNDATSLFSDQTFNLSYFSSENFEALDQQKVALGKKLFHEKAFSLNANMSCATCHLPDKQFTDGRKTALGNHRNSPTLFYAALQKGFFYDNRAGSLEGQIVDVTTNVNEFHTDLDHLQQVAASDADYVKSFHELYQKDTVLEGDVRNAIASYIRSLVPFNSKFDRNMNGLEQTLTADERQGFNLFMGKAKCATCHFPPVFNGTVPVAFKESEVELIGVPNANDTINATIDKDLGRYEVYHTEERKHFFKTPTVRNAALTAPFMHNGVYNTLEEVIDFYDRGGGVGIGIALENQTLPTDKLELTEAEKAALVAFIEALNDPVSKSPEAAGKEMAVK